MSGGIGSGLELWGGPSALAGPDGSAVATIPSIGRSEPGLVGAGMTVSGMSVLRRTRCGRSQASQREIPGGSVERMISSNRPWARVFSMAFIGSGSPTAPSAVAPILRRRSNSVSRLEFASAMPWSWVRTSAALARRSGSMGKRR